MLFGYEEANLFCFYDKIKSLAIVSFRNTLSETLVQEADAWLERLMQSQYPLEGILCDVKAVRRFGESLPFQTIELPLVFVVMHPYQTVGIQKVDKKSSQHKTTASYDEAFQFFDDFALQKPIPLSFNSTSASVYYDMDSDCACVIYYGIVNPVVTADVYTSFIGFVKELGIERVRGSLYDFRHVIDFDNTNLHAVRRTSSNLNVSYDMSHIAVALIVGTTIQERMVRMAMKLTPQEERKQIVYSIVEAYRFVDDFQAKRAAKEQE